MTHSIGGFNLKKVDGADALRKISWVGFMRPSIFSLPVLTYPGDDTAGRPSADIC